LIEESERDVLVVDREDDRGAGVIDALGELDLVELVEDVTRATHEVLVHKVHELVLGRILYLRVVLGLAEGNEVLSIEVVHIDIDLSGHALAGHRLATVAEEVEVLNARHLLEVRHDALAHQVSLLGVSHDAHSLVQIVG